MICKMECEIARKMPCSETPPQPSRVVYVRAISPSPTRRARTDFVSHRSGLIKVHRLPLCRSRLWLVQVHCRNFPFSEPHKSNNSENECEQLTEPVLKSNRKKKKQFTFSKHSTSASLLWFNEPLHEDDDAVREVAARCAIAAGVASCLQSFLIFIQRKTTLFIRRW